ncbi:hypothetical protein L1887_48031 [Cichorium endivia]|nr:hypothetical protein L1887_48031 [Cichorium endivia]
MKAFIPVQMRLGCIHNFAAPPYRDSGITPINAPRQPLIRRPPPAVCRPRWGSRADTLALRQQGEAQSFVIAPFARIAPTAARQQRAAHTHQTPASTTDRVSPRQSASQLVALRCSTLCGCVCAGGIESDCSRLHTRGCIASPWTL